MSANMAKAISQTKINSNKIKINLKGDIAETIDLLYSEQLKEGKSILYYT